MFGNKKIGGIRFIRIGRVNITLSVRRATVADSEFVANAALLLSSVAFAACGIVAFLLKSGVI